MELCRRALNGCGINGGVARGTHLREDFAEDGALVLAIGIFVECEGDEVAKRKRRAADRVCVVLVNVGHDVGDVEDGAVLCADGVLERRESDGAAVKGQLQVRHGRLVLVATPLLLPLFAGQEEPVLLVLLLAHGELCSDTQVQVTNHSAMDIPAPYCDIRSLARFERRHWQRSAAGERFGHGMLCCWSPLHHSTARARARPFGWKSTSTRGVTVQLGESTVAERARC